MEATHPPAGSGAHEFGPAENAAIGQAGRWIGYWSWISMLSGILMGLGSLLSDEGDRVGGVVMGAVYVIVGVYFRGAATSMKEVVSTAGNDVPHLMTALEKLASAFRLMVILVLIGVLFAVVIGVVAAGGALGG